MKFIKNISAALRRPPKVAVCFFVSVGVVSILLSVLLFYVPLALDDLWFLDGIHTPPGFDTFRAASEVLKQRLSTDTGRLGAIISPVFLGLFPKWIYNVLTGIIFFLLVEGVCRLACVRRGGLWSYIILTFCVVCLPWYDYLLILTYGINYIWAGTASVWAAVVILRPEKVKGRVMKCGAMVLCFVAGWMHEGYGIPLSAAAMVSLFAKHGAGVRGKYVIATVLGTIMTALSPAVWNRLFYTTSTSSPHYPFSELIMHFGPLACILSVYLGILIYTRFLSRRSGRNDVIFFITFISTATIIAIIFYCGPRITMPAVLFSFIGIVRLLAPRLKPIRRGVSMALSLVIMMFLCLHLVFAINLQRRLLNQFREIEKLFIISQTGEVYIDLIEPAVDLTLFKTTVRQFHEFVPRSLFSRYYGGADSGKELTIIPTVLEGFDWDKGVPSTLTPGLCIYRGVLVLHPDSDSHISKGLLELVTAEGEIVESRYRTQTFTAADGKKYTLVTPHACILNPSLRVSDARIFLDTIQ